YCRKRARCDGRFRPVPYRLHHFVGQIMDWLTKRRELIGTPPGLRNVVEADNRKILRYAAVEFRTRGIEKPQREQIGDAKDPVERLIDEDGPRGFRSSAIIRRTVLPYAYTQTRVRHARAKCIQAAHRACGARSARNDGEPAASRGQKMLRGESSTGRMVR